ncbi:MAG: DUF2752 domain-containing protein [Firmicutes bacterium]|nr:DUF2752 domain-containing protein [Bacillota bacterium]
MIKRIFENTFKNYKYYKVFNLTMLGFELYIIFYPLVASLAKSLFGFKQECPYKLLLGRDCPFCGGTRTFKALLCFDTEHIININAVIVFVFVGLNLILRIVALLLKEKYFEIIKVIDFSLLSFVSIYYITAYIIFFLNVWGK